MCMRMVATRNRLKVQEPGRYATLGGSPWYQSHYLVRSVLTGLGADGAG